MKNTYTGYQSTPFCCMSAKERYGFARFLTMRGANFRTALDRIMYRGYAEWERVGIRDIMREFTDKELTPKQLFASINNDTRMQLYDKLGVMGMCRNTTKHRFSVGSFKEWEIIGINTLFAEWQSIENHKNA